MAEEESDQEAERLGEELVAIVESPPGPVGLRVAGNSKGSIGDSSCGGGVVGISSRDYCRRFCQVRRRSAARTCHPGSGPPCVSWPSRPRIRAVSSARSTNPTRRVRVKLPLHLSGLGWGAGSETGMTCGFRVAEKVSLSVVEGVQLAGKLRSTDMPPLSQTNLFLPEGPAFLCFLPYSFSPRLESGNTSCLPFSAPSPLYSPLFRRRKACHLSTAPCPVIATPPPLLGSPVIPSQDPTGSILLV